MKILFAAAEVDPFSKVGGLADVAAALPRKLKDLGHDVHVVTPCHASAKEAFSQAMAWRPLAVPVPGGEVEAALAEVPGAGGVPVSLIASTLYFGRENVYGEPDDLLRYQFFCRAVATLLRDPAWQPDILHLNDWHTAPLAFALRNMAWGDERLRRIATIFTIHNLRYRGPDEFNDCIGQAIYYSDGLTTVSPGYAAEILTEEYGEGLNALLGLRAANLTGILNGIDVDNYGPARDPHIVANYDRWSLEQREKNRAALREEAGISGDGPLAAMVTRLTEQKGLDLLLGALPAVVEAGTAILVLGNGDRSVEEALRGFERAYPGRVRLAARFDEPFARRVYAGADMLLMPSRYEPCGLGQMIAMRYGCVPVGRRTGGLADTVLDPGQHAAGATGFLFDTYEPQALVIAVARAAAAHRDPATWRQLQVNGMARDASWDVPAQEYLAWYREIQTRRGFRAAD